MLDKVINVRLAGVSVEAVDRIRGSKTRAHWVRDVIAKAISLAEESGTLEETYRDQETTGAGTLKDPYELGATRHLHVAEVVTPAIGNKPAVRRCKTCGEILG